MAPQPPQSAPPGPPRAAEHQSGPNPATDHGDAVATSKSCPAACHFSEKILPPSRGWGGLYSRGRQLPRPLPGDSGEYRTTALQSWQATWGPPARKDGAPGRGDSRRVEGISSVGTEGSRWIKRPPVDGRKMKRQSLGTGRCDPGLLVRRARQVACFRRMKNPGGPCLVSVGWGGGE